MITISASERRRRMAVRHRLTPAGRTDDVGVITDDVVCLHSSDPATVHVSCLVRMATPSVDAVERALYIDRSVVRHHAMRRTIWVMSRRTARLAHATATAKIARAEWKRNLQAVADGTDIADPEGWLRAGMDELAEHLAAHGPTSTRELGKQLPHLVVPLKYGANANIASLNAHTKMLQQAGFDAQLVRAAPTGGWISSEYLWSATDAWLGEPIVGLDTREAAAELVDAQLRAFGPCTETDLRWWFGETATLIRTALADCGAESVLLEDGSSAWVAADDTEPTEEVEPWMALLPGLDPTAMGWKQRDWYLDPSHVDRLFDRFGNAGPTIVADGRIVGGWVQRPDATIVHELLEPLGDAHRDLLGDAIARMERMLDGTVIKPRFPARNQKELLAR